MAKRKNQNTRPTRNKGLRAIYAKARREFTAADLQKYTEIEVGIPLEKIIEDMEENSSEVCREKRKEISDAPKRKWWPVLSCY